MGTRPRVMTSAGRLAAWLGLVAGLLATGLEAQQSPGPQAHSAALSGTVLAADAASPLPYAIVTLLPLSADSAAPRVAVPADDARTVVTRHDGTYRFSNISPAAYRVLIRCIGYHAASVDVELRRPTGVNVSVALEVAPVRLRPIEVHAVSADLYAGGARSVGGAGRGRVEIERWRQRSFLTSDVRVLTHEDVLSAATLGATDPFRALQRLPGVTTRDNWTAEIWTRGAGWDQTRVYFDGLPLFNPFHAGGMTTAVNDYVLGSVLFHPGVRSVSLGEGAAGVVNLTSRPAAGTGDLRGQGTLNWLGVGFALERRLLGGRAGALMAARRSSPDASREIPKEFSDVVARFDIDLGGERRLELSGIWERDWIRQPLDEGATHNTFAWGNAGARLTLDMPVSGAFSRHTIGVSRFDVAARHTEEGELLAPVDVYRQVQARTDGLITYLTAHGEFGSPTPDEYETGWRAGYALTHQSLRYDGAAPAPHPVQTFSSAAPPDGRLTVAALWAEARWKPASRLSVQGGIRVEGSTALPNAGPIRLAPQLAGRYAIADRFTLTAGIGRSYQYLQSLAPAGVRVGPGLTTGHFWLLAGEDAPVLQNDLVSIGLERWLGADLLASVNLYARRGSGIALIDPSPGPLPETPSVVVGRNRAGGVETSVRRLAGRFTWAAGYTYSFSEMEAAGLRFPAAEDRRHAFDLTSTWHVPFRILGGSLSLAQAYTAASGAPYTRLYPGARACDEEQGLCETVVPDVAGTPNASRGSWHLGLDQRLDWERAFSAWRLGFYFHNRLALGHGNHVTYTVTRGGPCRRSSMDAPYCDPQLDHFEPDVPYSDILAGVRIWF